MWERSLWGCQMMGQTLTVLCKHYSTIHKSLFEFDNQDISHQMPFCPNNCPSHYIPLKPYSTSLIIVTNIKGTFDTVHGKYGIGH